MITATHRGETHTPTFLLSTSQRYAIAGAVCVALLPARAAIPLATRMAGHPVDLLLSLWGMTTTAILCGFMPFAMDIIQRTTGRPLRVRFLAHISLASGYMVFTQLTGTAAYFAFMRSSAGDTLQFARSSLGNAQTGVLFYAMAAGIVRAIQWSWSAKAADLQRRAIESAETERTRAFVENTLQPRVVAGALARVREELAASQPERAERTVHRLSRHARMLLRLADREPRTAAAHLRALRAAVATLARPILVRASFDEELPASEALRRFGDAVQEAALSLPPLQVTLDAEALGNGALRVVLCGEGAQAKPFIEEVRSRIGGAGWQVVSTRQSLEVLLPADGSTKPLAVRTFSAVGAIPGSLYTWLLAYLAVTAALTYYVGDVDGDPVGVHAWIVATLVWPVMALPLLWISGRFVGRRGVSVAVCMISVWIFGLVVTMIGIQGALWVTARYVNGWHVGMVDVISWVLPYALTRNVLVAGALTAVNFAHAAGRRLVAIQEATMRLRNEVALAEIREMEARIHPHFLFNALSSMLALIRIDPARAATASTRLADLFSRSVATAGVQEWSLANELDLVADYLAIQEIRFGLRMRVEMTVDSQVAETIIPRLLLQPLVENAVKHGVAPRDEPTRIEIAVRRVRRKQVEIEVRNDATTTGREPIPGRGLPFVLSRTKAFGGSITIGSSVDGGFVVRCLFPMRRARGGSARA